MHFTPSRDQSEADRSNELPMRMAEPSGASRAGALGYTGVSDEDSRAQNGRKDLGFCDSARHACSFALFQRLEYNRLSSDSLDQIKDFHDI
jgi:hypothetical protein